MKKKVFLLFFIIVNTTNAQIAISSSGSDSNSNNGSISFTIGQIVFNSQSTSSYIIEEGIQNPLDNSILSIESFSVRNFDIYPNPTSDDFTINFKNYDLLDLSLKLFEPNGKLIFSKNITTRLTKIQTSGIAKGMYIVKIIKNKIIIDSFKILKI